MSAKTRTHNEHGTTIWQLDALLAHCSECEAQIDGYWVPARPLGWQSIRYRLKAAWLVFTGRADAVTWYRQ